MKKILLILILASFIACSTENVKDLIPEEPLKDQYFLRFNTNCPRVATGTSYYFEVDKDVFLTLTHSNEIGDCEKYFSITDIEGTLYEGYYMGNSFIVH